MTALHWPQTILLDLDDTIITFDSVADDSCMIVPQRLEVQGIWVNRDKRPIPEDGTVWPFRIVKSSSELVLPRHM